jgi:hypothetical protein
MFAFEFTDSQSILPLGLSILALVFILRRTIWHAQSAAKHRLFVKIAERDDSQETRGVAGVERLEPLCGFAHEVEGRLQNRIAVLDRLIVDADREIIRLEQVLAESRSAGPQVTGKSRQPDAVILPNRRDAA